MNKNEILVGFLLTLCLTPLMGAWGLLAIIICPLLYALSGMNGQDKIWRRLGVPIVWVSTIFVHIHHLSILLAIPCTFVALSLGYGCPDSTDKGSALGRFFYKLCGEDVWWTNFLTRGTIYGLTLCPMYLLNR